MDWNKKGFKVDLKLVKSREWRRIEKNIMSGNNIITDESSQLEKAILRKLMTVNGFCPTCKKETEFTIENRSQNPVNVTCDSCFQRFSYVMANREDGAWTV